MHVFPQSVKEKVQHFGLMRIDQVNKYPSILILSSLHSFYDIFPILMEPQWFSTISQSAKNDNAKNGKQHMVSVMQQNSSSHLSFETVLFIF